MNLSFKQYRAIDLTIMAIILTISEALIGTASTKWFPITAMYSVSPTIAVVCIVMMRWSGYAVIHAVLGGAVFCFASGGTPEQFAVYAAGNCAMLAAMLLFKFFKKKGVAESAFLTALYVAAAYITAQVGRWLVSFIFDGTVSDIIRFLTTDSISLLFAMLIVLISRKRDGLFEDQAAYLLRIEEERKAEQKLREYDDFEN